MNYVAHMLILPNSKRWMEAAEPFSPYGAINCKSMLLKMHPALSSSANDAPRLVGDAESGDDPIRFLINIKQVIKLALSFRNNLLLFYWLPVFIYCLLIFIQSSLPSLESLPEVPGTDKALHFFVYAVLAVLFFRAFLKTPATGKNLLTVTLLSIAASSVYGISDEIHQHYVPSRSADIIDAIFNIFGALAGAITYRRIFFRKTAG